jgi:hypothetical protein
MSIATNLYTAGNPYYQSNESLAGTRADLTSSKTTADKENKSDSTQNKGDRVTLSKSVSEARTRDALGLTPTGPLKLDHFKEAAKAQETQIESGLKNHMKQLGIDKDQTISLSLDGKSNLVIKESFPGKKDLQSALNNDETFKLNFKKLSANTEAIDYIQGLKSGTSQKSSLVDYMSQETDYNSLLSLASRYEQIKHSENSIETILGISHETADPYTYVHET